MAIFPYLEVEPILQVNDKTRLSAVKSFISKDEAAITVVKIKPSTTDSYVTVTGTSSADWYLDWQYSAEGAKTVTLEITTNSTPVTITETITVVTSATDALYSNDQQLITHESDILKYVRLGRNTFKDVHRLAQTIILEWLDEQGYVDIYNDKFTKADIASDEVTHWSKYIALRLIFDSMSNEVEDIFYKKARQYEAEEHRARNRAVLRIDVDASGTVDDTEIVRASSGRMIRE